MRKIFCAILLVMATALVQASDSLESQYQFRLRKEIIFGNALVTYPVKGLKTLHLDVFEPANPDEKASMPCLLVIHAKKPDTGGRSSPEVRELAGYMANRGYVVIAFDYRSPSELGPEQKTLGSALEDIGTALQWTRKNGKILRIEPERIFLTGFSDGATALLEGVYHEKMFGHLKGAVIFRGKFLYRDPVGKKTPPLLIVNAPADGPELTREEMVAEALLKKAGVPCEVKTADGKEAFRHVAEFCQKWNGIK